MVFTHDIDLPTPQKCYVNRCRDAVLDEPLQSSMLINFLVANSNGYL
jgi:hypothetical protein